MKAFVMRETGRAQFTAHGESAEGTIYTHHSCVFCLKTENQAH